MLKDLKEFHYKILLIAISTKNLANDLDLKFNGILEGIEVNNFSNSLFETLIEKEIYVEEYYDKEKFEGLYMPIPLNQDDWFGVEGLFNGKLYYLNEKIYNEIYKLANHLISNHYILKMVFKNDLAIQISKIQGLTTLTSKLKFLKKMIKKLWTPEEDIEDFLLFMKVNHTSFFNDWEENIEQSLTWESSIFIYYLTLKSNEQSSFYHDTFRQWIKFSRKQNLINFCNEKILEIKIPQKKKSLLSDLIFKSDGLMLFNFIESKYPKEKNTAFYSYLYQFLQQKDKLLLTVNDSSHYKNYIIENTPLVKFSKIQKTDSKNQYRKNDNFELFEKWFAEYYSNASEDNLSNKE